MATKFITVPVEILRNKDLNHSQKFILSEIMQLQELEKGCIAQNKHFADLIGITKENVSRNINELKEKGYISLSIVNGSRNHERIIKIITLTKVVNPPYQNSKPPLLKQQETKGNRVINKTINKTIGGDLESHFESVWSYYPNKKGKGQFTGKKSKLKHVASISLDEWKTLINRYVSTVKDKQYLMHGSTFLNSGYVDYLDENWTDQERNVRDQSSFRTHDEWRYYNYIDVAGKNPTENDKIRIEQLRVKMEESLKCLV